MLRRHRFTLLLATSAITALASIQAHAVQRTHVSAAIGVDTNTATGCTPVAPCRTFQAAMIVTDPDGEVVVLDSGGYGAVTITRSVALIAPTGVYAGISVFPDANGVTIAAPRINVVLRGLTINGQGGNDGIVTTAGNKLTVENCVISNLAQAGIRVNGATTIRVINTIIRDNRSIGVVLRDGARATITRSTISGHRGTGVLAFAEVNSAITTADIADTTLHGNANGVAGFSRNNDAVIKISVRDSRVTRSGDTGLSAESNNGALVSLTASNNIISNNANGIAATNSGARVWASGNTVSGNINSSFKNSGAIFKSAGNNAVRNNGIDTQGDITPIGTK